MRALQGVQLKEEELVMEGMEELRHVPTDRRSSLASSPDRLQLRVQVAPCLCIPLLSAHGFLGIACFPTC